MQMIDTTCKNIPLKPCENKSFKTRWIFQN